MDRYAKNRPASRKTKIFLVFFSLIIVLGLVVMFFPFITNFVSTTVQSRLLEYWEKKLPEDLGNGSEEIQDNGKTPAEEQPDGINESNNPDSVLGASAGQTGQYFDDYPSEDDYIKLGAGYFFPLKISIPEIDVEWIVNEGADEETLKKGPGHIPGTVLPGQNGRSGISGHRTTYGAPFSRIDELEPGDLIYLETHTNIIFVFAVKRSDIVNPDDVYILEGTNKKELILTSCEPKYSAAQRLAVFSELVKIYSY